MRSKIFFFLLTVFCPTIYSQENYPVDKIDSSLLANADAVIRHNSRIVEIEDVDKVVERTHRVITILNESGNSYVRALEHYNESIKIKEQEAIIYDKNGREIEKYKEKDFKDQSNFDSYILFAENRISFLDYTPREYPYTVEYRSEIESSNSVFISDWFPVEGYDISVENSSFQLINPEKIALRYEERNFDDAKVERQNSEYDLDYSLSGFQAYEYEILSPSFRSFAPQVLMAINDFNLEGVSGHATDWKQFGKWMHDNLVAGHDEISSQTISKISSLTKEAKTLEEKARIIYKYVQDNTRYVAVMYGIGGWEPAMASEVDELGYGDCKGLTNYTKALMKSQGIESYYSVVYGGEKRNIDPDFTKMQGDHVILNIPKEDGTDLWLECTSQRDPFNYLGDFTDDRYVLRLKPEGGEIIKTPEYSEVDNIQKINCDIQLNGIGGFQANFSRISKGVHYNEINQLQRKLEKEQKRYYKNEWGRLQNLQFNDIKFKDDREKIEIEEKLTFSGDRLATKAGNRFLIPLSFIQQGTIPISKNDKRRRPFEIKRGKTFEDSFTFILPEGFSIETLPENKLFVSEFGSIIFKVEASGSEEKNEIKVTRQLIFKKGEWSPESYLDFQNFIRQVNHTSNMKAVILNTSKT
ncbi:DUF3857 domain-containing transglutaminase family protein [Gramella jeungdoensis]|uniref:DUF3857 domain-containing transglutaminase family protein n=1 Tax=Gramella jeungdoensis TaxID=708091 RepID=A0ABT0YZV0_9FLAO|nr:DUF3857 domain-containing protein [Gramella jeungdoensis]MCM8568998.1 DUF3857 domain-containing transglutaminase family protein [Gramella jeungdoensis]